MEPNNEPIAVKLYEPALDLQPRVDSALGTDHLPQRFRLASIKAQITRKTVRYLSDFAAHKAATLFFTQNFCSELSALVEAT